jgi:transposase-like protein
MDRSPMARFRRAAEQRQGLRYSEELKELGRRHAAQAVAEGRSMRAAARELGIGEVTLGRWLAEVSGAVGAFGEVVIMEPRPSEGVTLFSPLGWRVEGLSVSDLMGVLAALK